MRILTVRGGWAWAMFHAGKDIENRSRPTKYRGPLLIHCAQSWTLKEREFADNWVDMSAVQNKLRMPDGKYVRFPDNKDLPFGAIIGVVDLVNCVSESDSPWYMGQYGYVLENPRIIINPVEIKGQLGIYERPFKLKETDKGLRLMAPKTLQGLRC